ncbi:MAG: hypothetical protein IT392_07205 [Nitrospirae bacterium]|nr:hypothetical protein [Nitrospirota bacterium]
MKKGLIVILALAMVGMISFSACQKKEQPAPPPPAEQAPAASQAPAEQAPAGQAPAEQAPAGEHK